MSGLLINKADLSCTAAISSTILSGLNSEESAMDMEKPPLDHQFLDDLEYPSDHAGAQISLDQITTQVSLYRHLAEAKTCDDMIRRAATLLRRAGFSDFSHAMINTKEDSRDPVGTGKKKINKIYFEEQFYLHDLMLQHAIVSTRPILQSQVIDHINASPYDNEMFKRTREMYQIMQGFNIYEHYNIPFESTSGKGKALFSVGVEGPDVEGAKRLIARCKPALHVLAEAIDHIGSTRFTNEFHSKVSINTLPRLSAGPLRLLSTIAEHNCSLKEAAVLLNISLSTANQYSAAAKAALNANTLPGAILQAYRLRLISLD